MIHFVGAGPGAPDLITLRGAELLKQADVCIYAGSLVNPVLLGLCREDCAIYNSAEMTLEEVLAVMEQAEAQGKQTVRLATPASTEPFGSRWTPWIARASPTPLPLGCPVFAEPRRRRKRSTPCPA